jgi:hypothetical protein
LLASSGLQAQTATSLHAQPAIHVPFVGCPSDGQVGPLPAPKLENESVVLDAGVAQRLAYYKAENGIGILAPRGWHCFSTYGSGGENLYATPEPINPADLFSTNWKGFSGQAIQVSFLDGGTSGRFGVAKLIARVFPAHMGFTHDVIREGIEPASSFPSGPYRRDKLRYLSDRSVEFETPANETGLGTDSRLAHNDSPIFGAAVLIGEEEPSVILVSARLSPDNSNLIQPILRKAEAEAMKTAAQ